MKANYLSIKMTRKLLTAILFAFGVSFTSCQKDIPSVDTYLDLGISDDKLRIDAPAEGIADVESTPNTDYLKERLWYNVHTDYQAWQVEVEYLYDADLDWITIWPKSGVLDGRFSVSVARNKATPYPREAIIYVKSGGVTLKSIRVTQAPVPAKLELGMEGLTRITFASKASSKTARLSTNVLWVAEIVTPDADWLSISDFEDQSLLLTTVENPNDYPRSAVVRFTMIGGLEDKSVDLNVVQRDKSTDAEFADRRSIAEVLAQVGPTGGEVQGNVYVEAYVTSDLTTRNFDTKRRWPGTDSPKQTFWQEYMYENRYMWVQDDSGKGLMLEWLSGELNDYPLNTKVKMHLVGTTIVTDAFTGSLKIGSVEPDMIFDSEESTGITPVQLDSFDNIADYVNSLVTIDPVQFALPYGTYVNIDERYFNQQYVTDVTVNSVPYCETSRQYGHLIMDKNGNRYRLVTECTFTERYIRAIPQGSGPLTAIVTKNRLAGENHIVLRLRSDSDNEVSNDASTRLTKIISRFGPHLHTDTGKETVEADISNGTGGKANGKLRTGVFVKVTPTGNSTGMYWSQTYARMPTFLSSINIAKEKFNGLMQDAQTTVLPQPENVNPVMYCSMNANHMWNTSLASQIPDAKLGGWLITLNTEGITGDLYLTFDTSSSQSGPAWMRLQWKEITVESPLFTTKDKWNTIVPRYEIPNWDVNFHCLQYSFKLPDEIKGKKEVVIRHITDYEDDGTEAKRAARNGAVSGNGGTNRIGVWTLEELK